MVKAGKKQRWFPDKNGSLLVYDDLVWVTVYNWRLKLAPSQIILGRFLAEDDAWKPPYTRSLKIQIGEDIFVQKYRSSDLEKATPDCEELYQDQVLEFNSILMLEKLMAGPI
jgi:hypothetical protein